MAKAERLLAGSGRLRVDVVNQLFTELRKSLHRSRRADDVMEKALERYNARNCASAIVNEYSAAISIIRNDKNIMDILPKKDSRGYLSRLEKQATGDIGRISSLEKKLHESAVLEANKAIDSITEVKTDKFNAIYPVQELFILDVQMSLSQISRLMAMRGVRKPQAAISKAIELGLVRATGQADAEVLELTKRGRDFYTLYRNLRSDEGFG